VYGFSELASKARGGTPSTGRIVRHIKDHEIELYGKLQSIKRERREREEGSSFVYFIEGVGTDKIKIGRTIDPARRLCDLQIGSPVGLKLLHAEPGGEEAERVLHAKFATTRANGEWFSATIELVEYIEERKRMTFDGTSQE